MRSILPRTSRVAFLRARKGPRPKREWSRLTARPPGPVSALQEEPAGGPPFSRSLSNDPFQEAVEQIQTVVGSRPGFGVVLHGAAAHVEHGQALDRAVIEVDVAELGRAEVGLPPHGLIGLDALRAVGAQHGEAVVLRGD